jgi:hypothetical protein
MKKVWRIDKPSHVDESDSHNRSKNFTAKQRYPRIEQTTQKQLIDLKSV